MSFFSVVVLIVRGFFFVVIFHVNVKMSLGTLVVRTVVVVVVGVGGWGDSGYGVDDIGGVDSKAICIGCVEDGPRDFSGAMMIVLAVIVMVMVMQMIVMIVLSVVMAIRLVMTAKSGCAFENVIGL